MRTLTLLHGTVFFVFSRFRHLLFCLSTNCPMLAYFFAFGCFSFAVKPMAPLQLSVSNVADPDALLGSFPCILSRLPANGPTARPFDTTLQALHISGLPRVTRVPFSLLTLFPRLCLPRGLPSHPSAKRPRSSCYWYTVGTYPFPSSHRL